MQSKNQVSIEDARAIAQKHHQSGNLTLADMTYRDILASVPDDFISLHYLGIIAYQTENPQEGCEFMQQAIDVQDDNPDTWNAFGIMLAQLGKNKEAIEKWEQAIKLKPDFSNAYSNMGNTYWKMGELKKAQQACEKAVELQPELSDSYINLGNTFMAQGNDEKAIETWKKAIELNPEQYNAYVNIGNSLRELGRSKESKEYCEKGLERAPDSHEAHLNLANALRDLGQYDLAETHYRKATELKPDFADAHNNLSTVLMDLYRFDEAITAAKYAIAFSPNHILAHTNLAAALRETGKLREAEAAARKALKIAPDSIEAKIDLADILFVGDRLDEAETIFKDVVEAVPDSPRLYIKLSAVLERANRMDDALKAIEKALELNAEMPELYHRLGLIYFMSNKIQEALTAIDKAIELKPNFAGALATKSEILQTHGDMDGARDAVMKGLEHNSNIPFLYFTLSKLKKFTADDPHLEKMKTLSAQTKNIGSTQSSALEFALFKANEDIGEYREAFQHLKSGNDIKRKSVVFDTAAQDKMFAKLKQTYTKDAITALAGKGTDSDVPIFIVGMPRSGTTLTEQIISSHPDVFGAGELHYLADVEKELGNLNAENCKAMGELYIEKTRQIESDSQTARKITDKMPGNFIRVGQIIATMPNAKIIHCKRNPVDTCLSCYKQLFARGQYWSYNLDEMAQHYALYSDLMEHWRNVIPKENFLEIDYETTVNDFENQARKLLDFVDMPWDDACLTPHKTKRSILTASKGQVRKPIYKTSVEAWKRYEDELSDFAGKLKPFMNS